MSNFGFMLFNQTGGIAAGTSADMRARMMQTMQQGLDANARAVAQVGAYQSLCQPLTITNEFNPADEHIYGQMVYDGARCGQIHANFCAPSYAYSGCNNCPAYGSIQSVKEGKGIGRTMHPNGMLNIVARSGESIGSRLAAINRWLDGLPYGSAPHIYSFERIDNYFSGKPVYHIVFDLHNGRKKHMRGALDNLTVTPIGVCYEYDVLRMFDPNAYRSDQVNYTRDSNGLKPFFPVLDDAWVSQLIQDYQIFGTDA